MTWPPRCDGRTDDTAHSAHAFGHGVGLATADGNGPSAGGLFAYMVWTDNREVKDGADPRETEAENGFVDGFDVAQCLTDLGRSPGDINGDVPLARADAPYSGNNCGNTGGLDQDIYGTSLPID